jgi:hypothetical protein
VGFYVTAPELVDRSRDGQVFVAEVFGRKDFVRGTVLYQERTAFRINRSSRGSGHEITSRIGPKEDPAKCVSLYQMFVANVNFGVRRES